MTASLSHTIEQKPASSGSAPSLLHRILFSKEIGMMVLLVLLLLLLYLFAWRGMRFFMVPTASMEPTLLPNDMIVSLRASVYHRGDIVVWREEGEYMVKRIIGLPGDNISVVDGALFINGKYASEPYMLEPMRYHIQRPVRIPEGRFFYLGDNRNASDDSSLGFLPKALPNPVHEQMAYLGKLDSIIGKVRFIYYPYPRFGRVYSYPLINVAEI